MKTHQREEMGGDDFCLLTKDAERQGVVRVDISNMAWREAAHSDGMGFGPTYVTTGKYISFSKLSFPHS